MIPLTAWQDHTVAVLGLGKSGFAAAQAMAGGGASVLAWDDNAQRRAEITHAAIDGVSVTDLNEFGWSGISALIPSPGIPTCHPVPHPIVAAARAKGVKLVGDIDLLTSAAKNAVLIGITGTNGKSTTTALLAHILEGAGRRVQAGGNLGRAALDFDPPELNEAFVLEVSSYQLDLVSESVFDLAVLINISPDHLDRHGGMAGYVAAKRKVFHGQGPDHTAVIGVDDEDCRSVCHDLHNTGSQRVLPVSLLEPVAGGVYVRDGVLWDSIDQNQPPQAVGRVDGLAALPGRHNWQNAACGYAAARALGVESATASALLASYPGLPHRQELVGEIAGVRFINDSKATNVTAACQALACYNQIYWIAGGRGKSESLEPLRPFLSHISRAYLIGEAAESFSDWLGGEAPHSTYASLVEAVSAAFASAEATKEDGAVVLLSPACASFDQFKDFEDRGDTFKNQVQKLLAVADSAGKS